ncbi:EGF family domain-containing protein [Besnoitia besnoiti]|uniref:EGF family domain-containing protein n=1 Tax=Besnoitia besnoiti TaxID=94643 RepID=A0A2A9M4A0_BESBE|nr:EGF family domain-containing protein [Besnoitia besnoiti]PFH31131.1 EGF family domain-containing protein [Besnoitia besnoiti]
MSPAASAALAVGRVTTGAPRASRRACPSVGVARALCLVMSIFLLLYSATPSSALRRAHKEGSGVASIEPNSSAASAPAPAASTGSSYTTATQSENAGSSQSGAEGSAEAGGEEAPEGEVQMGPTGPVLPETAAWVCRSAESGEGCGPYFNSAVNDVGAYCPQDECCSKNRNACTNLPLHCTFEHSQFLPDYSYGRCSASQCWQCGPNAKCLTVSGRNGGVYCDCKPPYVGKGANCTVKMCEHVNPCGEGLCVPGEGEGDTTYSCKCNPGFTLLAPQHGGVPPVCMDVCLLNSCGDEAAVKKCVAGRDDYMCVCNPGYRLATLANGIQKCVPFDACSVSPCGSSAAVESCTPDELSYKCTCKEGYVERYTDRQAMCIKEEDCVQPHCTDKAPPKIVLSTTSTTAKPSAPSAGSGSSGAPNDGSSGSSTSAGGSDESDPGSGTNVGVMLGAVGGSLLGLLLIGGVVYFVVRAKNKPQPAARDDEDPEDDNDIVSRKRETIFGALVDDAGKEFSDPVQAEWEQQARERGDSAASSASSASSSSSATGRSDSTSSSVTTNSMQGFGA